MAEAYSNLPWFPDSGQFLKAIIAGGDRATDIARLRSQANLASAGQPLRINGLPHVGGGGRFRPEAAEEEAKAPQGAHIGGIPGSPMLVDPARENQGMPFELGGKLLTRDPSSGNVVPFAPTNDPWQVVPLGQGGVARVKKDSGESEVLIQPRAPSANEANISQVDTTNMSPEEKATHQAMAMFNPPKVSGKVSAVNAYLNGGQAAALPSDKRQLQNGQVYETAKGPAVWDGDSFKPVGATQAPTIPAALSPWARFGNPTGEYGNMGAGSGNDPIREQYNYGFHF